MNEIREYQITQYSNSLIKGLKWVILVIFFSQVFQFVSIGVFDISQDSLFIQPRWTFNIQYAIRHILFGSGMPLTIYLIILLLNKKFQNITVGLSLYLYLTLLLIIALLTGDSHSYQTSMYSLSY